MPPRQVGGFELGAAASSGDFTAKEVAAAASCWSEHATAAGGEHAAGDVVVRTIGGTEPATGAADSTKGFARAGDERAAARVLEADGGRLGG